MTANSSESSAARSNLLRTSKPAQPNLAATIQSYNNNPIEDKSSKPKKINPRRTVVRKDMVLLVLIIILIGALALLGYKYYQVSQSPTNTANNEINEVISSVKNFVNIDESEQVNVAKIDDPDLLRQQNKDFYKDAVKGQYLVVLTTTQRVLIYDKEKNKIINFSTYNIQPELVDESKIPASEKPLNIEIRSTANIDQATLTTFINNLSTLSKNYKVVANTKTINNDYKGITMVIINKAGKPNMVKNLQNQVAASPGTKQIVEVLPSGEPKSTADVVIIIGQ